MFFCAKAQKKIMLPLSRLEARDRAAQGGLVGGWGFGVTLLRNIAEPEVQPCGPLPVNAPP